MPRQLVQIGQIDQQGRVFADADMGQMQQGMQGGQTVIMGGGGFDLSLRAAASGFQALTSLVRRANLKDLEDDEKDAREALRTQANLGNQLAGSAGTDPVKQQQAILAMANANMKVLAVLDANSALNKEQDRMATDSAISGAIGASGVITVKVLVLNTVAVGFGQSVQERPGVFSHSSLVPAGKTLAVSWVVCPAHSELGSAWIVGSSRIDAAVTPAGSKNAPMVRNGLGAGVRVGWSGLVPGL